MGILTKVFSTRERVIEYLRESTVYRDDDEKLVARYWSDEIKEMGYDNNNITCYAFLCLYSKKKLTSATLIERARRKIQEAEPSLRGERWELRHDKCEEVRVNI
jgi:hypothetical protein